MYGATTSKAALGPEATAESLPAFTTLALPLTGAAMRSAPSPARRARQAADSSAEIDEQSTKTLGVLPLPPAATPSLPKQTCSTSLPVETIKNTTSQPASAAGVATICAPSLARGSALARVRFQTLTRLPALSRNSAMGSPMRPNPIQPMLCLPAMPVPLARSLLPWDVRAPARLRPMLSQPARQVGVGQLRPCLSLCGSKGRQVARSPHMLAPIVQLPDPSTLFRGPSTSRGCKISPKAGVAEKAALPSHGAWTVT